jgi:hypothetical protein
MKNDVLAQEINKFLEKFGTELDGRPRYKLAWAPDCFEIRKGTFDSYVAGTNIFIKSVTETRQVPKYTYLGDCYVIEQLIFGCNNSELPLAFNGSYEPMYAFRSEAGIPLPLNLRVAEIVMDALMYKRSAGQIKSDDATLEELKDKQEFQANMDMLECSTLGVALRLGSAVTVL